VTSTFDRYQRIAPFYDLLDFPFERGRYRAIRPLLFEGLSGVILDAGVGTGAIFRSIRAIRKSSESISARPCWHTPRAAFRSPAQRCNCDK
jgi:ubiquinone/menaquinone biosynthesis C-methylase UbiE